MAVSYQQAEDNRSRIKDAEIINGIEQEIDNKLMDADWLTEWACGEAGKPFWRFSFKGHYSDYALSEITRRYKEAAWSEVTAENVSFPNPNENCMSVILYK